MDHADRLLLVSSPGPEVIAALALFAIGFAGMVLGVLLLWRGQLGALALLAVFPFLGVAAVVALLHVPTRFAVDRDGIEMSLGVIADRWRWHEIDTVTLEDGLLGPLFTFVDRRAERPGFARLTGRRKRFYLGFVDIDRRALGERIEAWRKTAARP